MQTPHLLIRPELDGIPPYNAGLSIERMQRDFGLAAVTKLDSNENPYGPSPAVREVIQAAALTAFRYPDRDAFALRRQIAGKLGVEGERLLFGNGSEELISVLYQSVLRPGDRVLTVVPGFGLHTSWAKAWGAEVVQVPFTADWRFPVEALARQLALRPRVMILSAPANPVGTIASEAELRALLAAASPETLLVFDEAYIEYVAADARVDVIALLRDSGLAWLVLRTFSKAYGLAALRLGYGVGWSQDFVANIDKLRPPFSANALALAAANAAFRDEAHLAACTARTAAERTRLAEALAARGLTVAPSQGNFLFFDCAGDAAATAAALRREGVLVKPWQEDGYRHFARVTVGTAEESERFLAALDRIVTTLQRQPS